MDYFYLLRESLENGDSIDKLHYLFKRGGKIFFKETTLTTRLIATFGRLDYLQFAYKSGCPWDEWTCFVAAMNGHYDCLKYIIDEGCPISNEAVNIAVAGKHFKYVDLLQDIDLNTTGTKCIKLSA